jgi:hypothetical protein
MTIQNTLIDDMQRRLQSKRNQRRYLLADGTIDTNTIPAKHIQVMTWLAQRLGMKLSRGREEHSTPESRRAVAVYYLDGKSSELIEPLCELIDKEIDRAGAARLGDVHFSDVRLPDCRDGNRG